MHVAYTVGSSDNAGQVLDAAGPLLASRPVEHQLVATILTEMVPHPGVGQYWWVVDGRAQVVALAVESPAGNRAVLTPARPGPVKTLAQAMASDVYELPGVLGDADTAATFAGYVADLLSVPAYPVEGGRLYRLRRLVMPKEVAGHLRLAETRDEDLVITWARAFRSEAGEEDDPTAEARRRLSAGRLWLWEDGEPVAMAGAPPAVAGVARVGWVYTPSFRRRRGYGSAVTAALSRHLLDTEADTCILYTQLHNPTSNAIYQRMGYQRVAETVSYRFGARS